MSNWKRRSARLSGGERARVMIARLMLAPADVLLLDEPTNDLDIPTLEVLEDSLLDFAGAMVLVSHDRYLLDRVSTIVIGLDGGQGGVFADYSQWEAWRGEPAFPKNHQSPKLPSPAADGPKRKLSYLEQREWDGMEARILEAEQELAARQHEVQEAASDGQRAPEAYQKMQDAPAARGGPLRSAGRSWKPSSPGKTLTAASSLRLLEADPQTPSPLAGIWRLFGRCRVLCGLQ